MTSILLTLQTLNSLSFQSFGKNKTGRGHIPDRGSCPLSTQLMEDRLRNASGPVQPSVLLHTYLLKFAGHWIPGQTAGGCRNSLQTFALNPQYWVSVMDPG